VATSGTLATAPASIPRKLRRMNWFIRLSSQSAGWDRQ
jgi:hypothetical protein